MKVNNLKKTISAFTMMGLIALASVVRADEISLSVITKPSILEEGTQREP